MAVSSRELYMTGASCGCFGEKEELGSRKAGGVFFLSLCLFSFVMIGEDEGDIYLVSRHF